MDKITKAKLELAQLQADRFQWEQAWQDVIDYVFINRAPILGKVTPGDKRTSKTFDSTATNAHTTLSSVIESMLASPAAPWLSIETTSEELNKEQEVKDYCSQVVKVVLRELSNSNFYTASSEMVRDLTGLGTGSMSIMDSKRLGKSLSFNTRHIREMYPVENSEGQIDRLYRVLEMTGFQVVDQFSKHSEKVTKAVESGQGMLPFQICHYIEPNKDYQPKDSQRDTTKKKYIGTWFEMEGDFELESSGYDTFPFVIPRWGKDSSEVFGRSPAVNCMADIKTLNQMDRTMLRTAQKACDPPVQVPDEGFIGGVKLTPGGVNFYRAGRTDRIEAVPTGANFPLTDKMIEDRRNRVVQGFLVNQLQLINEREMTAEEVRQRTVENARVIGPVYTRLTSEYLDRLVERVLEVLEFAMDAKGNLLLPPKPPIMQKVDFRFRYISPLAKQQRMADVQAIDSTVATAAAWAEVQPDVPDNIDFDKAISILADLNGTPSEVMRSDRDKKKIRENRQVAQAKVANTQLAEVGANMAKTRAETADIAGIPGAAAPMANSMMQAGVA